MKTTTPTPADRPVSPRASGEPGFCERHFAWILLGLLAAAAAVRAAVLHEFWTENPFARFPILDSAHYWQRAGEIAGGAIASDEPFHVAPLYPYGLAGLRRLGADPFAVSVLQLGLHLSTALLVGLAARIRFGSAAGCLAAALFLALAEPALFATRLLGVSVQLLWVALLWWDWAKLAQAGASGSPLLHLRVGVWIGLLALAFPAAMLLAPAFGIWALRQAPPTEPQRRAVPAALGVAAAAVVIAPATIHNAVASGEFIPITSHAGVTLAAGNGPGSAGIFTSLAETSGGIADQAAESARAFERATGRAGSWREIDAWFRDRVLRWWREHPVDAAALFARKAWWFVTSRHYDNVTAFALEREHGLQDASRLLPLELPWLLGLAAVGVAAARARRRRLVPEIAIVSLALFVCVVFMYSARYRILAAPVLCGLAAAGVVHWRAPGWRPASVAACTALPFAFLALNASTGFGSVDFMRADFARVLAGRYVMSGLEHRARGDRDAAIAALHRAVETSPERLDALRALAGLYLETGRVPAARSAARAAVAHDPDDALAQRLLHDALVQSGAFEEAGVALRRLATIDPEDAQVQIALAWYYATCPDRRLRDPGRAVQHARTAETLAGADDPDAAMAMALAAAAAGRSTEAAAAARRGAGIAADRGDAALARSFAEVARLIRDGRAIASRPRLLASL